MLDLQKIIHQIRIIVTAPVAVNVPLKVVVNSPHDSNILDKAIVTPHQESTFSQVYILEAKDVIIEDISSNVPLPISSILNIHSKTCTSTFVHDNATHTYAPRLSDGEKHQRDKKMVSVSRVIYRVPTHHMH